MKKIDKKLKEFIELDKQVKKLPFSQVEKEILEFEQRFEATYYSNKLAGNKLTKVEARRAIQQ